MKKNIIICDLDGTIYDISHRLHFIQGEKKDWDNFYNNIDKDTFIKDIWDKVIEDAEKNDADIIIMTGRPERVISKTIACIIRDTGKEYPIFCRKDGDHREDYVIKKEMFNNLSHHTFIRVYEDRQQVIKMWKELGLDVVECGSGEYY